MKKSRARLALLPLIPGSALAQSSVTLYGIVDAGIEYINSVPNSGGGGSSLVRMSTGNLSTSRWGLRGVEDWAAASRASSYWRTASTSTPAAPTRVAACSAAGPSWACSSNSAR